MDLNNREIATLIWLAIIATVILVRPSFRKGALAILTIMVSGPIRGVITLLAAYIVLQVWFLAEMGIWHLGQTKSTIIWSLSVALVSVFRANKIGEQPGFFAAWFKDNLRLIAFIEFLVSFYTFSLPVEFFLLPVVTFVVVLVAVGERDPAHKPVVDFLNTLLTVFGGILIIYALYMIATDFAGFANAETARDFLVPILLSLTLLPFIFVLYVYISYETAFNTLKNWIADDALRRYAKLRAILSFGPSVTLLKRWVRNLGTDRPETKKDVKRQIREVKLARARERNPEPVDRSDGWSPYLAKDFLQGEGFVSGDFHRFYDIWYADTQALELDQGIFPNRMIYRVEGNEHAATGLELTLTVNRTETAKDAENRFRQCAHQLMLHALPAIPDLDFSTDFTLENQEYRIALKTERWEHTKPVSYERRFSIELRNASRPDWKQ